jgi:hypothetical protein
MSWHGVVWRGVVWYGWMTARVCSGRLFKRGRGETVWDRLESTSEGGKGHAVIGVVHNQRGGLRRELGVRQGGLAVRDGVAKVRESWS